MQQRISTLISIVLIYSIGIILQANTRAENCQKVLLLLGGNPAPVSREFRGSKETVMELLHNQIMETLKWANIELARSDSALQMPNIKAKKTLTLYEQMGFKGVSSTYQIDGWVTLKKQPWWKTIFGRDKQSMLGNIEIVIPNHSISIRNSLDLRIAKVELTRALEDIALHEWSHRLLGENLPQFPLQREYEIISRASVAAEKKAIEIFNTNLSSLGGSDLQAQLAHEISKAKFEATQKVMQGKRFKLIMGLHEIFADIVPSILRGRSDPIFQALKVFDANSMEAYGRLYSTARKISEEGYQWEDFHGVYQNAGNAIFIISQLILAKNPDAKSKVVESLVRAIGLQQSWIDRFIEGGKSINELNFTEMNTKLTQNFVNDIANQFPIVHYYANNSILEKINKSVREGLNYADPDRTPREALQFLLKKESERSNGASFFKARRSEILQCI